MTSKSSGVGRLGTEAIHRRQGWHFPYRLLTAAPVLRRDASMGGPASRRDMSTSKAEMRSPLLALEGTAAPKRPLAEREYAAGRYTNAASLAREALAEGCEDAAARRLLGKSQLQCGEWQAGIATLELASLEAPIDEESRILLAIAYGIVGRRILSRDLLMAAARSGRLGEAELLRVASALESIDEPQRALHVCRAAGRLAPDSAAVSYQMGFYAARCGEPLGTCEALIRRAVELEPKNVQYRVGLASLLLQLGRDVEAFVAVDPVIPSRLDDVSCECCLKKLANLFFDFDDVARAKLCAGRLAAAKDKGSDSQQPSEVA